MFGLQEQPAPASTLMQLAAVAGAGYLQEQVVTRQY
jgi:hypothetical protein